MDRKGHDLFSVWQTIELEAAIPHNVFYMDRKRAKRWVIRGSVQGVGFRFFVQQKATALGLTGWARNLDDGTVEVYAAGSEQRLADLASALHAGPTMADVRGVEERDEAVENLSGFSVR